MTRPNSEWVPFSEQLPALTGHVLVADALGVVRPGFWRWDDDNRVWDCGSRTCCNLKFQGTHWMRIEFPTRENTRPHKLQVTRNGASTEPERSNSATCHDCDGEGWLWRHELPDTRDWDGAADDQRYTCTTCKGTGVAP